MEADLRQKRINNSKHFFKILSQIENEIQSKTELIEKLINSSAPAEYRNNLQIYKDKIGPGSYNDNFIYNDWRKKTFNINYIWIQYNFFLMVYI